MPRNKNKAWLVCGVSLAIVGCQAQPEQPLVSTQANAAETATVSEVMPNLDELREAIANLEARITATQDNLLSVHGLTALQNERLQAIQTQLQVLSQSRNQASQQNSDQQTTPALQEMQFMLDQLALAASEVSNATDQGHYELTGTYTKTGHWVLIRFDKVTGQTWLADAGAWKTLTDNTSLPLSVYEVSLTRADKDLKGFVAARIDKRTGQSWWLNQNIWEEME
ncbi:MAG: hypothetical protein ACPGPF_08710 [Pontibacterium sp.]